MRKIVSTLCILAMIAGCNSNSPTNTNAPASGTVYLWISSDKDAYASCGATASCEEQLRNFGTHNQLVVADWEFAHKRSYVHFPIPTLPDSTEILEAYIELFHSGKNEDGKSDDILIPVALSFAAWSPLTLNWSNKPEGTNPPGSHFSLKLESQAWSGSPDITGWVKQIFANPSTFFGFTFWWSQQMNGGLGIEKGFYSNNDLSRTQNDLGKAPRLLLKLKLPSGKTTNDITLPFFAPDNDLTNLPRPTTMMLFRSGSDWPSDWNVSFR